MTFPVWIWPGPEAGSKTGGAPTQVGELELGRFTYGAEHSVTGGNALDPDELRFTRKRGGIAITSDLRERIPGVISDAGPDSWGRLVLAQDLGFMPDALQALVSASADGAGNLAVGDLHAKPAQAQLKLDDLADAIARRQHALGRAETSLSESGAISRLAHILSPDTALGGAKPKASLMRDGTEWIAKFPERGDPDCLPFFEATALRVAALCGIESAEVEVHSFTSDQHVLLVKRFDRVPTQTVGAEPGRLGFASALTVMGPQAFRFSDQHSYLGFAHNLVRWLGRARHDDARAAIWQRIAYNALVGNTDDHARNHALIREQGEWRLSPVFDIVPTWRASTQLSLSLPYYRNDNGTLSSHISAGELIRAAPGFGLTAHDAQTQLMQMAASIQQHWLTTLEQLGAPSYAEPPMSATLAWAAQIQREAEALSVAELQRTTKSGRGWGR